MADTTAGNSGPLPYNKSVTFQRLNAPKQWSVDKLDYQTLQRKLPPGSLQNLKPDEFLTGMTATGDTLIIRREPDIAKHPPVYEILVNTHMFDPRDQKAGDSPAPFTQFIRLEDETSNGLTSEDQLETFEETVIPSTTQERDVGPSIQDGTKLAVFNKVIKGIRSFKVEQEGGPYAGVASDNSPPQYDPPLNPTYHTSRSI